MLPEIQIRVAEPQQSGLVARVLYESFVEFESLYTRQAFAATTPDAEQVRRRMAEGRVWAAFRGGDMLGTVAALVAHESLYMRGMAVLPAARGLRLGTRLLEQVEAWSAERGCARILLSTTPFLTAAIGLYESSGFRRTGEGPHDLFGTALFTMEKVLPAIGVSR